MITTWANRLRSDSTRKSYVRAVKRFAVFCNTTIEETVHWSADEAEEKIQAWQDHLVQQKGWAGSTVRLSMAALKRWFHDHKVRIIINCRDVPLEKTYLDYLPTKEEIQTVFDDLRLHYKVGLALIYFSGLRSSDATDLQYKHIKVSFERRDEVITIVKRHLKTKEWYVSFLGPQGTRYLRALLGTRKTPNDNDYIVSTTGRVKIKANSLSVAIDRAIVRRIGKHPSGEDFRRFRVYGFRKAFRRVVNKLGEAVAEYLMGHVSGLRSLVSTYNGLRDLDPQAINALKKDYIKILPELETEITDITLRAQLEEKEAQKKALVDDLGGMKDDIAELRVFIQQLRKQEKD